MKKKNYLIALAMMLYLSGELFSQTHCPERIGYMQNGACGIGIPAFYIISTEQFNANGAVLDLNGSTGPCNTTFQNEFTFTCDGTGYLAADINSPVCTIANPTGTVTFSDGTVCQYENGVTTILAECIDFVQDCKEPLLEFAQDFIPHPSDCKLWEGPCTAESEIWRNGNVSIGTINTGDFKLAVKGGVTSEMLQICIPEWCDYVFSDTFRLLPLAEVQSFIRTNRHLPGCTPGPVIEEQGGFFLDKETLHQQEKIEEIFLHLISIQKRLDRVGKEVPLYPTLAQKVSANISDGLPEIIDEYPPSVKYLNTVVQIECFQINPAQTGMSSGVGGIIISPGDGPFDLSWSGGQLNDVVCQNAIKIENMPAGNHTVTVSDNSGVIGTCVVTIGIGQPANCNIFKDIYCREEVIKMLSEEAFSDVPDCIQWEGDPCSHSDNIYRQGNVGIGTSVLRAGYSLAVKGGIVTDKFRVELCESGSWCDYVFEEDYYLPTLYEVEQYIDTYKHLPGAITQNEVTQNGGFEMRSVKLDHQEKIEEAYLYLIQLNKKKKELEERLNLFYKD